MKSKRAWWSETQGFRPLQQAKVLLATNKPHCTTAHSSAGRSAHKSHLSVGFQPFGSRFGNLQPSTLPTYRGALHLACLWCGSFLALAFKPGSTSLQRPFYFLRFLPRGQVCLASKPQGANKPCAG